jgi:hypothetical protein
MYQFRYRLLYQKTLAWEKADEYDESNPDSQPKGALK